jgi:hypothetical protein
MATPIKPTPILTGKASTRFNKLLAEQKNQKVSPAKMKRMLALYKKVIANSKYSK